MGHKPLTFKLSRAAHGTRNLIDTGEEARLQAEAKQHREVLLPGVDVATAFALHQKVVGATGRAVVHAKRLSYGADVIAPPESMTDLLEQMNDAEQRQALSDTALAQSGFAVFMHESWRGLSHVIRYFDLVEKNEATDTSLLEWLVVNGAVDATTATATVTRFKKKTTMGRFAFVLDAGDAERLRLAAEVRGELEREEAAKH